jgi:hypothetical protein
MVQYARSLYIAVVLVSIAFFGGPFSSQIHGQVLYVGAQDHVDSILLPGGSQTMFPNNISQTAGVAVGNGAIFVADTSLGGAIFKYDQYGNRSTFVSGLGGVFGGMTFDGSGNLYLIEETTASILKFTPGGTESTFATGLAGGQGITFQGGFFYVAGAGTGGIAQVDGSGTVLPFLSGGVTVGGATGITFGLDGNIYVTSSATDSVYQVAPDGSSATLFAPGFASAPVGIAADGNGNLFVADNSNGGEGVYKVAPDGTVTIFEADGQNEPLSWLAFATIPEPGTWLLFGLGAGSLVVSRRAKKDRV